MTNNADQSQVHTFAGYAQGTGDAGSGMLRSNARRFDLNRGPGIAELFRTVIRRAIGPRLLNLRFLTAAHLAYAPGHFYSPVCDPSALRHRYRDPRLHALPTEVPGIDLNHNAQVALWENWRTHLADLEHFFSRETYQRYQLPSGSYDIGDATIYGCMLQHLLPRRLIEVGSGSSSAVALDVSDRFLTVPPRITFIEPYPSLLESLLRRGDRDRVEIIASGVQDVPPALFDELQANDLLFIDSTHIVKTGSDVVFELFEVLPRLRPGVVVHFHDVFYPFEYPREWVIDRNYSWNELYALRAFLTGNHDWEIMFFNDYFVRTERARVERDAPQILRNPGGGLWLRRR